jgi:dimethylaniline monooxygenase (N-oxide forming)
MHKKAVIVGSGPCGLVALKELIGAGHDAILFERSSGLGGVFASKMSYPGLHLTISNWMMAFSDHPDPSHLHYPTAEHYLAYLHSYAQRFNLGTHCRYNTEVLNAQLGENGRWELAVNTNERRWTVTADTLVVATGANSIPKDVTDHFTRFQGRVMHSADYNSDVQNEISRKQLRVLIVGGGESAADISAEISSLTKHAAIWLRRPIVLAPRYTSPGKEISKILKNRTNTFPTTIFLEASTTNRLSAMQNVYFYGIFRRFLWRARISLPTLARMCLDGTRSEYIKNDQAAVVTKNQRMCEAIAEGNLDCVICPSIEVDNRTITFRVPDRRIQCREFDLVLLCTGYGSQFSWLNNGEFEYNPRKWFLHCFPPSMGSKLAFIGYARPQQGGIPACAEILSRHLAQLLAGKAQLPKDLGVLAERDETAERQRFSLRPEMETLVDYNAFMESVARRIGCEPRLPSRCMLAFNLHMLALAVVLFAWISSALRVSSWAVLLWIVTAIFFFQIENGLLIKWWIFPQWSVWYRQRGPGAQPQLLWETMQKVRLREHVHINLRFAMFVVWCILSVYVQRVLSVFIFLALGVTSAATMPTPLAWMNELRPKLFALHSPVWRFEDLFLP